MSKEGKRVIDSAAHQPRKPALFEDVSTNATPEGLAWAITRGGTRRRDNLARIISLEADTA